MLCLWQRGVVWRKEGSGVRSGFHPFLGADDGLRAHPHFSPWSRNRGDAEIERVWDGKPGECRVPWGGETGEGSLEKVTLKMWLMGFSVPEILRYGYTTDTAAGDTAAGENDLEGPVH